MCSTGIGRPVLTVGPGDTVVVRSFDASGYLARQRHPGDVSRRCSARPGALPDRAHRGRGAQPAMILSVRFVSVTPADWGWTVAAACDNRLTRRLGVAAGRRRGCCGISMPRRPPAASDRATPVPSRRSWAWSGCRRRAR